MHIIVTCMSQMSIVITMQAARNNFACCASCLITIVSQCHSALVQRLFAMSILLQVGSWYLTGGIITDEDPWIEASYNLLFFSVLRQKPPQFHL